MIIVTCENFLGIAGEIEEQINNRLVFWMICKNMKVIGIDFTSRPTKFKPLTCAICDFDDETLVVKRLVEWPDYQHFENFLITSGPWVAGIDFPFGQSRKFIKNIHWPNNWSDYVKFVAKMKRDEYRKSLNDYREHRPYGDKEHKRATDIAAGSISPQKIYGVPVGLMFFEGAPRLLEAGVTLPGLLEGDPKRIVFEAYPGVLVRRLIGRRSYKQDDKTKQTGDQLKARGEILDQILSGTCFENFKVVVKTDIDINEDASGDKLDAVLCAVQAAWAWKKRDRRYGRPYSADNLEGWIADPVTCRAMDDMAFGD